MIIKRLTLEWIRERYIYYMSISPNRFRASRPYRTAGKWSVSRTHGKFKHVNDVYVQKHKYRNDYCAALNNFGPLRKRKKK